MNLNQGNRLGSYTIVGPLGAGGMGEVYRAHDSRLGRDVAIKVLPANLADDAERVRRFEQEGRAVAALNHPNIVTIYEVSDVDGTPYMATELVDGETLRDRMNRGRLTLGDVLDTAVQIADGLAHAHEAGVVHRDLKPQNVMVKADGLVKIIDFGVGRVLRPQAAGATGTTIIEPRTAVGAIVGTIGYMAPEQISGREIDGRADQFSFGAVLYEMISGQRAFTADTTVQTMSAVLTEEPRPLESLATGTPPALVAIVKRCLAKAVEARYPTTRDLLRELKAVQRSTQQLYGVPTSGGAARPSGDGMQIGPFAVLGVLGTGSAGVVYRAHNTVLDRDVALKQMHSPIGADAQKSIERFRREARRMAGIHSPNVVSVYSYQEIDGKPIIEMELVEGGNLEAEVVDGPLPADHVVRLAHEILTGLAAVHDLGVLHRDIKPGNILKSRDGRYLVNDFGLAGTSGQFESLRAGTLQYAAPEQLRAADQVDGRADLYSVGMVCYESLLGREGMRTALKRECGIDPHGDPVQWMAWVGDTRKELPALHQVSPGVPTELSMWVARLTAKDPDRRFPTALEAISVLDASAVSEQRPREQAPAPATPRSPLQQKLISAAAAVLFVVVVGGGWIGYQVATAPPPPSKPKVDPPRARFPIEGVVLDGGSPVASARISLDCAAPCSPANLVTPADGTFRFDGLLPGKYAIGVESDGYEPIRTSVDIENAATHASLQLVRVAPPPEPHGPVSPPLIPPNPADPKPPLPQPKADTRPPKPPPAPVRVGGSIPAPRVVKNVPPEYPAAARAQRLRGVVTLDVTVGTDGKVMSARVVSPAPPFDDAALAAVRQWLFEPTAIDGVPTPVIVSVAVPFRPE